MPGGCERRQQAARTNLQSALIVRSNFALSPDSTTKCEKADAKAREQCEVERPRVSLQRIRVRRAFGLACVAATAVTASVSLPACDEGNWKARFKRDRLASATRWQKTSAAYGGDDDLLQLRGHAWRKRNGSHAA
jgi:hypothetical protein